MEARSESSGSNRNAIIVQALDEIVNKIKGFGELSQEDLILKRPSKNFSFRYASKIFTTGRLGVLSIQDVFGGITSITNQEVRNFHYTGVFEVYFVLSLYDTNHLIEKIRKENKRDFHIICYNGFEAPKNCNSFSINDGSSMYISIYIHRIFFTEKTQILLKDVESHKKIKALKQNTRIYEDKFENFRVK